MLLLIHTWIIVNRCKQKWPLVDHVILRSNILRYLYAIAMVVFCIFWKIDSVITGLSFISSIGGDAVNWHLRNKRRWNHKRNSRKCIWKCCLRNGGYFVSASMCWHYLPWWRHQMEILSALLALCAGNSPVTGEFPAQSRCRESSMFSLICA